MYSVLLPALSPVLGLCVNVLVQITLKMKTQMRLLQTVAIGYLCGQIAFLCLALPMLDWVWCAIGIGAYMAASFCYFGFVNLNATSLRIRILEELRDAGGSMAVKELLEHYGGKAVLQARLQRLVRSQLLIRRGNTFFVGKKYPLYAARILDALRFLILKQ